MYIPLQAEQLLLQHPAIVEAETEESAQKGYPEEEQGWQL